MIMIINKEIIMTSRNTKQKEIILDILQANRIHPTIHEIYELAKEKYPSIGQATIYRNVNKLVEEGKIIKLPNNTDDSYHYDIDISSHDHLLCKKCGKIIDIFDNDYNDIFESIEKKNKITIDRATILLEGNCSNCNK